MSVAKWFLTSLLMLLFACGEASYPPPESAIDAGRQFASAIFTGNFKRANDLIVPDAKNKDLLGDKLEKDYHQRSSADRNDLAQSSLQILDVQDVVKDSITIIQFINSYDKRPAILKVVKYNGAWLVDLKYTFSGNL